MELKTVMNGKWHSFLVIYIGRNNSVERSSNTAPQCKEHFKKSDKKIN